MMIPRMRPHSWSVNPRDASPSKVQGHEFSKLLPAGFDRSPGSDPPQDLPTHGKISQFGDFSPPPVLTVHSADHVSPNPCAMSVCMYECRLKTPHHPCNSQMLINMASRRRLVPSTAFAADTRQEHSLPYANFALAFLSLSYQHLSFPSDLLSARPIGCHSSTYSNRDILRP
jgi:hypothetical protein